VSYDPMRGARGQLIANHVGIQIQEFFQRPHATFVFTDEPANRRIIVSGAVEVEILTHRSRNQRSIANATRQVTTVRKA
jgi:hypothetical protein